MRTTRKYNCSDANFIEFVDVRIALLEKHHHDFERFSNCFTSDSLIGLKKLSESIIQIPSDSINKNIVSEVSLKLRTQLRAACQFYQHCMFDVKNTFPDNKQMWIAFGYKDYKKSKSSVAEMLVLLEVFKGVLIKYSAEINTQDWTDKRIEMVDDHIKTVCKLKLEQQACKNKRLESTQLRVQKLNEMYSELANYFKAAKLIYWEDKLKLSWFNFSVIINKRKNNTVDSQIKEMTTVESDRT